MEQVCSFCFLLFTDERKIATELFLDLKNVFHTVYHKILIDEFYKIKYDELEEFG